jgi:hypothetical protein
MDEDPSLQ